jgi:hypothetical protein
LSRPAASDDRQQATDSGSGRTDLQLLLLLKRASFFHAAKRISSREVMHTASSRSTGINTDERQPRFHVPRCIRAAGPGKTRIRSGAPSSVLPAPAQNIRSRHPWLDAGHRPSRQQRCCTLYTFVKSSLIV